MDFIIVRFYKTPLLTGGLFFMSHQKERLPKAGSLTGEDCGVACRRLKATWQGLLPFRGRTGNGAVTRHVAGSDVLR